MVKIIYFENPNLSKSKLKELYKFQVVDKNILEIKNEILRDYAGEFETVGKISIGDQIRTTLIRFRNIADYEAYTDAIDQDYESEDAIVIGYFYENNTPQINLVNRSQYGIRCDFKHQIKKHRGNSCNIPTKGYCFIKCISFLTGKNYKQQYLDFY